MTTTTLLSPLLSDHVQEILRPRERLSILEWAKRYMKITEGPLVGQSGAPVPWSPDTFPLQTAMIEAIDDTKWSKVAVLGPPQAAGKTQSCVMPVLLHALHHLRVPAMYVAGNAELANAAWDNKLKKALEADPELSKLLHENPDLGGNRLLRKFTNDTHLHTVGSESAGNLSQKTAPKVVCDDVQAYPATIGPRFGHPADYAATRTGAYPAEETCLVYCGTAGIMDEWLWRTMKRSAFFLPFVPCPACGTFQLIEFDRMQFDHGDPEAAINDTWLKCAGECDQPITFDDLPLMLKEHRWVSMPPDVDWVTKPPPDGVKIDLKEATVYPRTKRSTNIAGFWTNALYWPWGRTWGQLAAEFISRQGDPDKLKDFQQNILTIPWAEPKADEDAPDEEDVKAHASAGHHWGMIPEQAGVHTDDAVLIITADVQAGYIWYVVCVWNLKTGTCWLIEVGRFGNKADRREFDSKREKEAAWKSRVSRALDGLWTKNNQGWPVVTAKGEVLVEAVKATKVFIDCGFLRETVQNFCRLRNGGRWIGTWIPVEGSQAKARSKVPVWPGAHAVTIEKKSKRRYYEINTNRAKLYVRELLAVPTGEPGSLILPEDMPDYLRDQFAKQLCAEEWDKTRGTWKKRGENHILDCMAEQISAALSCGVKFVAIEVGDIQVKVVRSWFGRQRSIR
ncbi:MAG: phage terminase large subunit family protein [Phycisphaerales bacterium]|nr:phage terminase large subunit family protein [Phycisphaerales bacterium]